VRRGCIAIGKVECSGCDRPLKHGEHYLVINGEDNNKQRLCIDCCSRKGHITKRKEKGKDIDTFLPGD